MAMILWISLEPQVNAAAAAVAQSQTQVSQSDCNLLYVCQHALPFTCGKACTAGLIGKQSVHNCA